MDEYYFKHKSTGELWFDPLEGTKSYKPWWLLVKVDRGIIDFYGWLLKKYGIEPVKNHLWGPHISVVKGEEPENKEKWTGNGTKVDFYYSVNIRYDNGLHSWLDVFCPDMYDLRQSLGLVGRSFFHITIGRIR